MISSLLKGAALAALLAAAPAAAAQHYTPTTPRPTWDYTPAPENLKAREWFQDAKFGVFLHWGLYSQLGGVGSPGVAEWIMNDRQIPAKKYERLAQFFNPTQFDADEWVRGFKAAGANYIVITSKHHDGFAMYDSKVSNYDIVESTPFKRDPIKELAAACRKHGVKLFFYYSQLDWHHPDYFPRGHTGAFTGRPERGDWQKYLTYQDAQLRELLTQYGPIGGLWLDGWWDHDRTDWQHQWRLDRTYKMIHELQPAALIVNNHHQPPFPGEDYQAFERDLPGDNSMGFNGAPIGALPLEMAETMNGSWGFSLIDTNYKSTEALIRTMVGSAGRGANFLLNTGPMPNGKIQPENMKTFQEIGAWLKVYGRSIYGTRKGPIGPRPWGVTTQSPGKVYVHVLDWADDRLFVPLTRPVRRAVMVADGKPVAVRQVPGGIEIPLPAKKPGDWDRVVELQTS